MAAPQKQIICHIHPDGELSRGVARVLKFLNRRWFDGRFAAHEDLYMARLLFAVFDKHRAGEPLNKKAAADAMGAEDIKTARKYVALAEQEGFIIAVRDANDKRKERLSPTPLLERLLEEEVQTLQRQLEDPGDAPRESVERDRTPTILRFPLELRPYARRAADLVEAIHGATTEQRSAFLNSLEGNLLLFADFRNDGTAKVARLNGPWGMMQEGVVDGPCESETVRRLFLPNSNAIKILPGTHHYGFDNKAHPDDLEAAQSVAADCRQLLAPSKVTEEAGLFPADDLDGTLIFTGGVIANAATRLVLQYTRVGSKPDMLQRVENPVIPLRYEIDTDRTHSLLTIAQEKEPNWGVLDTTTGERFSVECDAQQRPRSDYLMVTVVPNFLRQSSFDRGDRIVIFSGVHGAGTKASALLLRDANLLNRIRDSIRGAVAWQALIKVSRIGYGGKRPVPLALETDVRSCVLRIPQHIVERFRGGVDLVGARAAGRSRRRR